VSGNGAEVLGDLLAPLIAELEGTERSGEELRVGGRPFAVLRRDHLEVALDPAVAAAAQRTPDVTSSPRGPGWVRFRPRVLDGHAVDRAQAWLRSAHRGASSRR
jgi:hypothetical protein